MQISSIYIGQVARARAVVNSVSVRNAVVKSAPTHSQRRGRPPDLPDLLKLLRWLHGTSPSPGH
jgi:hypothetical protein